MATTLTSRSFTRGRFGLTLGGVNCGFLKDCSGAEMKADLVVHDSGGLPYNRKNISQQKWAPVKCSSGAGMSRHVWQWIESSMNLNAQYRDGSVHTLNYNNEEQRLMEFYDGLLTEVAFADLKGDAKANADVTWSFTPERVRLRPGSNSVWQSPTADAHKGMRAHNWQMEVADLPCKRINTVAGIKWKCGVAYDAIGDSGSANEYTIHPTKFTVDDISISFSTADLAKWADKAHDWFTAGNNSAANEFNMALRLMDPAFGGEVILVEFLQCGFKEFFAHSDALKANEEAISSSKAVIYCEHMKMTLPKADA